MPKYALTKELQHSIICFGLIKENYISVDSRKVTLEDFQGHYLQTKFSRCLIFMHKPAWL